MPRPDRLSGVHTNPCVRDHSFCVRTREHPQSRISIRRCYKRCRCGAMRGVWEGDSRGIGGWVCKILQVNFREFLFHALR